MVLETPVSDALLGCATVTPSSTFYSTDLTRRLAWVRISRDQTGSVVLLLGRQTGGRSARPSLDESQPCLSTLHRRVFLHADTTRVGLPDCVLGLRQGTRGSTRQDPVQAIPR